MNKYHQELTERGTILWRVFDGYAGKLAVERRISSLEFLTKGQNPDLTMKIFSPIRRKCYLYIRLRTQGGFLTKEEGKSFNKRLGDISVRLQNLSKQK